MTQVSFPGLGVRLGKSVGFELLRDSVYSLSISCSRLSVVNRIEGSGCRSKGSMPGNLLIVVSVLVNVCLRAVSSRSDVDRKIVESWVSDVARCRGLCGVGRLNLSPFFASDLLGNLLGDFNGDCEGLDEGDLIPLVTFGDRELVVSTEIALFLLEILELDLFGPRS
jgi:hypothetical protein